MTKLRVKSGGGWPAIRYSLQMGKKAGGLLKLYRSLRGANTCKTCAFGMGGLKGGMRNELDQSFQVCKKSMQAQAQDMQPGIPAEFFKQKSLNELRQMSGRELESLGRLIHPLFLTPDSTHFQVLDWQTALDKLIKNWRAATPERSFFYTSGRSSMEAAFLIQLLARQWGTNNVNNCSYYCHQASGVGLNQSLGGGTSTVTLEDISRADLVVLIGANPASNHPRLMTFLIELKRRGGKVIVINPFRELGLERFKVPSDMRSLLFGSSIADLYLQPHCGGDLTLLKAAAVRLWSEKKLDIEFLGENCNQVDDFIADLETADLHSLLEMSGVSFEELARFCNYLIDSQKTIYAWAMGITHHLHGVENVRAIANLALMRGMVGKPGAGLLPIRGHSNVQGVGTVGVVPQLKPEMAKALLDSLNIELSEKPGKDTFSCMQAAHKGEVDFALLVGGNLYGANPDLNWASEALNRIGFTAFLSTTLNLGHVYGHGKNTIILPVRARDEEKQATSQESMFNYVRLSRGGQRPPAGELPSESQILSHVGKALFGEEPVPWSELENHGKIRKYIARTVPGLRGINDLDSGREFTIPGRIKHLPQFNTENKKANLAVVKAHDSRPARGTYNLMTFRSEGQFNTIVYEDEDIYRGVEHRQVVFMNFKDIFANGWKEGFQVKVESKIGSLDVEVVAAPIREGNVAMYYPEANHIVPGEVDPQSRTPAFKHTSVEISLIDTETNNKKVRSPTTLKMTGKTVRAN